MTIFLALNNFLIETANRSSFMKSARHIQKFLDFYSDILMSISSINIITQQKQNSTPYKMKNASCFMATFKNELKLLGAPSKTC